MNNQFNVIKPPKKSETRLCPHPHRQKQLVGTAYCSQNCVRKAVLVPKLAKAGAEYDSRLIELNKTKDKNIRDPSEEEAKEFLERWFYPELTRAKDRLNYFVGRAIDSYHHYHGAVYGKLPETYGDHHFRDRYSHDPDK